MAKRITLFFLCIALSFAVLFCFSSCDDKDQPTNDTQTTEAPHVHSGGTATCTDSAVCESCGDMYGEKDTDNHTGSEEWTKTDKVHKKAYSCCGAVTVSEAAHTWADGVCSVCEFTCTHSGGVATCEKKAVCENCGEEYGELAEHLAGAGYGHNATHHWHTPDCVHTDLLLGYVPHNYIESVTPTTCTTKGYTTYTCECGESYTFDYVGAPGHDYSETFQYTASQHWRPAVCEHTTEKTDLGPHVYETVVTDPTCTEQGYTTYTCECGYSYVSDYTDAKGHTVDNWKQTGSMLYNKSLCEHAISYDGTCKDCGASQTKTDYIQKHSFYWEVKVEANCKTDGPNGEMNGLKVRICAAEGCIYHDINNSDNEEMPYSDPHNHAWGEFSGEGTATHQCDNCGLTKTVVEASDDGVDGSSFNNADEIKVSDVTMEFDDSIKGGISEGSKVNVGADTLTDEAKKAALNNSTLTPEQKAQIGDKPIYDFTISKDNGKYEFEGIVTIRIPYALSDGENPNEIVVWFISDKCDENGKNIIEPKKATYENGFIVFTTDHFSLYVPARLTPAEYCEIYDRHSDPNNLTKKFEPTCTTEGYTVCLHCGEIIAKEAPRGHEWHTEITKAATCDENGIVTYSCVDCEMSYEMPIPAIGHQYLIDGHIIEATCTADGSITHKCARCDDSYTTTLPQTMHNHIPVVKDPTCTEEGYTENTCTYCGDTLITDGVEKLGHSYDATWHTAEEGHYHVCTRCGARGELHSHKAGAPATELSAQICTECEYIITPPKKHVHDPKKVDAKPVSCTENGNIEYYVCEGTNCGKWFLDKDCQSLITDHTKVYIIAQGHDIESVSRVEPTCTETGYTAGLYCKVCKEYISGHVAIEPRDHSYSIKVTAPTCTTYGETVYTCHCNYSYTVTGTELLEHKYSTTIIAPTCIEEGHTIHTCVYCGYEEEELPSKPALGHKYSENWTVTNAEHSHECVRCGDKIDVGEHIPDCGEATDEHGINCTVCGYVIEEMKDHVHSLTKHDAKAPTCTSPGTVEYYSCKCGAFFYDEARTQPIGSIKDTIIAAKGHSKELREGKAPTCYEEGYTDGYYCAACETWRSGHDPIPALGHEYSDTVIAPNCTDIGYTRHDCVRCDHYYDDNYQDALGHKYSEEWTITASGHSHKCIRCTHEVDVGDHIPDSTPETETNGISCTVCGYLMQEHVHRPKKHDAIPPSCTDTGRREYYDCPCGKLFYDEACTNHISDKDNLIIAPLGHSEELREGKTPTCYEEGYTDGYYCTVCETWQSGHDPIPALKHNYINGKCEHCGDEIEIIVNHITTEISENAEGNTVVTVKISNLNMSGIWLDIFYGAENELLSDDAYASATYHDHGGNISYILASPYNFDYAEIELITLEFSSDVDVKSIKIEVREIYFFDNDNNISVPNYAVA